MTRLDIEKVAFVALTGEQYADSLIGSRSMNFAEYERITYILHVIGFDVLLADLIQRYDSKFQRQVNAMENMDCDLQDYVNISEDYDELVNDFLKKIKHKKLRDFVKESIKKVE